VARGRTGITTVMVVSFVAVEPRRAGRNRVAREIASVRGTRSAPQPSRGVIASRFLTGA